MKTLSAIILMTSLFFISCKSGGTLFKQEQVDQITQKVESQNYKFVATTAVPMTGKSINLNYPYTMKVSKDSIDTYLPYFGRAYSAPLFTGDGGIKFVSTDFDYSVQEKKDTWDVRIKPKGKAARYSLSLNIGNTGYATLTVQDTNRQSITFYGKIE